MTMEEKYETGLIWQDFQHRELIELFVKLKKAREDRKDKNAFDYTMAFLAMYVHHHFKLEEEYMDIYDYPDRKPHREKHREFITTVREFRATHTEYSEEAMEKLLERLKFWILGHILGEDKLLSSHIRKTEQENHLQ